MLLIEDSVVRQVLSVRDCIPAVERAFREHAEGIAVNVPRMRYKVAGDGEAGYVANMLPGAVPSAGVAALRYDSSLVAERDVGGKVRKEYLYPRRRSFGFVLLFSLHTGEILAIVHDFSLSGMRVGATTGVAIRALAREDAATVGLLGSGNEARANLEAVCAVRNVEDVKVYSPNEAHREAFAREMGARLGVGVRPVGSALEAVRGSDVVVCATNTSQPLLLGEWLQPGQTVATIVNSDRMHRRSEVDSRTMQRAQRIVINSRETAVTNDQRELLDLIEDGTVGWDKVHELGEVLTGRAPGREGRDEILYYKNNSGMGIQFAAAAAVVHEECKRRGLGREIPTEWFGADVGEWLDRGYSPSP